jgi:hypothetical protein
MRRRPGAPALRQGSTRCPERGLALLRHMLALADRVAHAAAVGLAGEERASASLGARHRRGERLGPAAIEDPAPVPAAVEATRRAAAVAGAGHRRGAVPGRGQRAAPTAAHDRGVWLPAAEPFERAPGRAGALLRGRDAPAPAVVQAPALGQARQALGAVRVAARFAEAVAGMAAPPRTAHHAGRAAARGDLLGPNARAVFGRCAAPVCGAPLRAQAVGVRAGVAAVHAVAGALHTDLACARAAALGLAPRAGRREATAAAEDESEEGPDAHRGFYAALLPRVRAVTEP